MFALLTAPRGSQLTWTTVFVILGSVAAIALALWLLERLFPGSSKYRSAGGNALVRLDTFFHPGSEHVVKAKEHEEKEDEESGDPPGKGGTDRS